MKALLVALVLPLAAAGCGNEIEDEFGDRADLPDCGRVNAGLDLRWRAKHPAPWTCFADAHETGSDAELAVVYLTDEGDPIRAWYRLAGDNLEIYEDATEDRFGSEDWSFTECPVPERFGRTLTCS